MRRTLNLGLVHQRDGKHVHRAEAGENEAGEATLDLLEHQAEGHAAGVAQFLQSLGELARHRQHIAHVLLALALRDDEVLLERIEVTQEKVAREIVAELGEVVIEADQVHLLVRFEFIGLLGQEGDLDRIAEIGVGDGADGVGETEPLLGVEHPVGEVRGGLDRELMA